MQLVIPSLSC
uniref:Uncharacterized protein n=1 Tax=Arundo donax TaxID=35708 RepID=A0A0A9BNK7_ARUDO